ncbi:MAG TPA: hypothetical protein VJU81_17570 [Methylomirabilota bacterium]|nr:hypothetical protein [Methylomirabilota bacterium]
MGELSGIHVLIVEDDVHARDFLRQVLEMGDAVVTLTTVADALEVTRPADVIVCESALLRTRAGGWMLRRLQHLHYRCGREARAIVLLPPGTSAAAAQATGFPHHLTRPVDGEVLRLLVARLCRPELGEAG